MSIRIKKKSKLYKIFETPTLIDKIIFGYLGGACIHLLVLDKIMHHEIKGRIKQHIKYHIKLFSQANSNFINVLPHLTANLYIKGSEDGSKGGCKVLIPLYFSISSLKPKTRYSIRYSYSISKKGLSKSYAWSSEFYVTDKLKRQIWLYKQNHTYGELPVFLMDVMSVRGDDVLCLYLPFYSFGKQIQKMVFYGVNMIEGGEQVCQIQSMYNWEVKSPISKMLNFNVQDLRKMSGMNLISLRYSSVQKNCRVELECVEEFQMRDILGCQLRGRRNGGVGVVLGKKGCYYEGIGEVQLRIGDRLVVYLMGC